MLSGFLIGRLLVREWLSTGTVRIGRFLFRRGVRIYPPFYLLLAATGAAWLTGRLDFTRSAFLAEVLFIQNYVAREHRVWNHTWSLAVEEQFYLLLPVLLGLLARARRLGARPLLILVASLIGLVFTLRAATWLTRPFTLDTHFLPLHLRLDGLMVGVALATAHTVWPAALQQWTERRRGWLVAGGCLVLAPITVLSEATAGMYTVGLSLFAVGWAAILLAVLHTERRPRWLLPLVVIGQASYGIYLFHPLLRSVVDASLGLNVAAQWDGFWIYAAASVAAGLIIHHAVERPLLVWRDRMVPHDHEASAIRRPSEVAAA